MPSNERCEGCGVGLAEVHRDECPTQRVVITDKRGQNKLEEELKAVKDELHVLESSSQETTELKVNREERIAELKDLLSGEGFSADDPVDAWREELLRLQAEQDSADQEDADRFADYQKGVTAFLVIVDHQGKATATSDVNMDIIVDREATIDDMYAGCSVVLRDIQASMTAGQVVFGLQVSAQAMKEKNAAMQVAQSLAPGGRVNLGGRRR